MSKEQQEQLIELAQLVQLYLLQEHSASEWIYAESESYAFFKQLALAQKKQPVQAVPQEPTKVSPPPPPTPQPKLPVPAPAPQMHSPKIAPQPIKQIPPAPIPVVVPVEDVKIVPAEAKEPSSDKSRLLKLERMEAAKPIDFSDWRAIMAERFPGFKILDTIPDDSQAKLKADRRNIAQTIVVSVQTIPLHQAFCENIAAAIDICLAPAIFVNAAKLEKEQQWEALLSSPSLKLILVPNQDLQKLPNLYKHYRKGPSPSEEFLGKIPVLVLSDIEAFLKEPAKKKLLWETLETIFSSNMPR